MMKYLILANGKEDYGFGQQFTSKEEFLNKLSSMIDDCASNGGTIFDISVTSDASYFDFRDNKDLDSSKKIVDLLGGIHSEGIGWNPNGVFCGECGNITCKGCKHSNDTE